ncbi:UBP16 hydrolase, partial [Polypterus senegalus]
MPVALGEMITDNRFCVEKKASFVDNSHRVVPCVGRATRCCLRSSHHSKRVGNYVIGRKLGEGSFAKVREGLHALTGEKVAVKIIDKKKAKKDSYMTRNLRREGQIQQMIRHPNITQLFDILETENCYYLIMELCLGGSLMQKIYEQKRLEEPEAQKYVKQLMMAVDHLHRVGVVHRSLMEQLNQNVLVHMTQKMGFKYHEVVNTVLSNRACHTLAVYFLLNKKIQRYSKVLKEVQYKEEDHIHSMLQATSINKNEKAPFTIPQENSSSVVRGTKIYMKDKKQISQDETAILRVFSNSNETKMASGECLANVSLEPLEMAPVFPKTPQPIRKLEFCQYKKDSHLNSCTNHSSHSENRGFKESENQIHKLENKKVEKENKNEQHKDNQKNETVVESNITSSHESRTVPVKGFSNLGNTCFFNAVLQDPIQIKLDRPGPLTLALWKFLAEIQETKKAIVTPKELFFQVCKKAARFKGFQQQDSQELLRYLLDGMRSEEYKRIKAGISEALNDSEKKLSEEETRKLVTDTLLIPSNMFIFVVEYEKKAFTQNFVDQVFSGEITSTIKCEECETISFVTEMFLDLSLSISCQAYKKKQPRKTEKRLSEFEDNDDSFALTIDMDDIPTSVTSKYQQKKLKKQAKKQAKNHRRQQKLKEKITPLCSANLNVQENQCNNEALYQDSVTQTEIQTLAKDDSVSDENELKQSEKVRLVTSEPYEHGSKTTVNSNVEQAIKESDLLDTTLEEEEEELINGISGINLNEDMLCHEDIHLEMNNCNNVFVAKEYTVVKEDQELAFVTLAKRDPPAKQECSAESCLYQFTEIEKLADNNKLLCNTCTKRRNMGVHTVSHGEKNNIYTNAQKQMLISVAPPVLTLHIKRFQQTGYGICKENRHVQFPQILDLAPFCTVGCKKENQRQSTVVLSNSHGKFLFKNVTGDKQVLYSLYGVVEHSGTMRSGHYTAFVKVQSNTQCLEHLNGTVPEMVVALKVKHYEHSSPGYKPSPIPTTLPLSKTLVSQSCSRRIVPVIDQLYEALNKAVFLTSSI